MSGSIEYFNAYDSIVLPNVQDDVIRKALVDYLLLTVI
jgi:hypothetical protein